MSELRNRTTPTTSASPGIGIGARTERWILFLLFTSGEERRGETYFVFTEPITPDEVQRTGVPNVRFCGGGTGSGVGYVSSGKEEEEGEEGC